MNPLLVVINCLIHSAETMTVPVFFFSLCFLHLMMHRLIKLFLTEFLRSLNMASKEEYGVYVKEHIKVGMQVIAAQGFLDLEEGDIGTVMNIDSEGLMCDFNVEVCQHLHVKCIDFPIMYLFFCFFCYYAGRLGIKRP